MGGLTRRAASGVLAAGLAAPWIARAEDAPSPALQAALDYVRGQRTTGFLIERRGKRILARNWPAPADARQFRLFAYETNAAGELLEDVASQQKSFVSVLVAIAVDKGLLDVQRPVSAYIGEGWSKASREQESAIRVIHLLTMSSGLTEGFAYAAPTGGVFLYNTPVYAVTKRVLAAAARRTLDEITRDWLTGPCGMADTAWRKRPGVMADVGNPTGLVTSPGDVARFGRMVLNGGLASSGARVVSMAGLKTMFERSDANPAYGRLWWLNGSSYAIHPLARRSEGPLIPSAPADLVAALGALDRKLYLVPSLDLVVVRMGDAAPDKAFDTELWTRLMQAPELR